MQNICKFFLSAMLSFAVMKNVYAGKVTIPNVFSSNTPAKAADVNNNFNAVASAINASADDISALQSGIGAGYSIKLYDSQLKAVGWYVGSGGSSSVIIKDALGYYQLEVERTGFTEYSDYLFYLTLDCTGTPYYFVDAPNTLLPFGVAISQSFAYVLGETIRPLSGSGKRVGEACKQMTTGLPPVAPRIRTVDLTGWIPPFSIR